MHGRLSAVNVYETLGYGTHLILDGFRAEGSRLADADQVGAAMKTMEERMHGPRSGREVVVVRPEGEVGDGLSAALVAAESFLCIHTFSSLGKLSFEAFSTRSLPAQEIVELVLRQFTVGRYECTVHGRCRLLPVQREKLEPVLKGDRLYARLRLRDLLGG